MKLFGSKKLTESTKKSEMFIDSIRPPVGTSEIGKRMDWKTDISESERIRELKKNGFVDRLISQPCRVAFGDFTTYLPEDTDPSKDSTIASNVQNFSNAIVQAARDLDFSNTFARAAAYAELTGIGFLYLQVEGDQEQQLTKWQKTDKVVAVWALSLSKCTPVWKGTRIKEITYYSITVELANWSPTWKVDPSRVFILASQDPKYLGYQYCLGDLILYPCAALLNLGVAMNASIRTALLPLRGIFKESFSLTEREKFEQIAQDGSIMGTLLLLAGPKDSIRFGEFDGIKDFPDYTHLYNVLEAATGMSQEAILGEKDAQSEFLDHCLRIQAKYYEVFRKAVIQLGQSRNSTTWAPLRLQIHFIETTIAQEIAASKEREQMFRGLGVLGNYMTINEVRKRFLGAPPIPNGDETLPIYQAQQGAEYQMGRSPNRQDEKQTGVQTGSPVSPQKPKGA